MISDSIFQYLSMALLLGLSSGLTPGPLLTLVITQTIKYNKVEGIKVAISPVFTDLPIILLALFVIDKLSHSDLILGIIALLGGTFIAYLGIESFKTRELIISSETGNSESLKKGIIANFLNPHPYIFWISVNAPMVYKAYQINLLSAILYITTFYVSMMGSKILIAMLVAKSKSRIDQRLYSIIMKILGIILLLFATLFFYDATKYLLY